MDWHSPVIKKLHFQKQECLGDVRFYLNAVSHVTCADPASPTRNLYTSSFSIFRPIQ